MIIRLIDCIQASTMDSCIPSLYSTQWGIRIFKSQNKVVGVYLFHISPLHHRKIKIKN